MTPEPERPLHELHELLMELIRVAGLLQPDRAMPGQPVPMSHAFALHELDTDQPLSQRELAERLQLEKSTVSRMAAHLERHGLLVRERDPDNRRIYRLRLTDQGRALHRRIAGGLDAQFAQWAAGLTRAELDGLRTGLPALIRAMRGALIPDWVPHGPDHHGPDHHGPDHHG